MAKEIPDGLQFTGDNLIIYETAKIRLTVLAGIELYHLERLRVTLKIESNDDTQQPATRQSVDLYNDHQVEKLSFKVSERLQVTSASVHKALSRLTDLLEEYRSNNLQQDSIRSKDIKSLTAAEAKAAKDFLSKPKLMERTSDIIARSGIVGEAINSILLYLIYTGRKSAMPLHAVNIGTSGSGKTYLQERIASLIPEEDKMEITSLSSNALYYLNQTSLKNKLLLIEDLDGAQDALFPLRELQSKQKIIRSITAKDRLGNTYNKLLTVEGPVCISGCTTKDSLYEDNANRSFLLYMDESTEQDEAVMRYQRKKSAGSIDTEKENESRKLLQDCQRILEPISVRNPFAENLMIPVEVIKRRRANQQYLQLIETITFYHQYQRKHKTDKSTGEIYIESTVEDITTANRLMQHTFLRKSDALKAPTRNYLESLKQYLKVNAIENFSNRDIQYGLKIPHSSIMRYHKELLDNGLIRLAGKESKVKKYKLYEEHIELKHSISNTLEQNINTLQTTA